MQVRVGMPRHVSPAGRLQCGRRQRIAQNGADDTDSVLLSRGKQPKQPGFVNDGVVVEQEKIVGSTFVECVLQGQVIPGGKTQIVISLQQSHARALVPYSFDAIILRTIVYYPDVRCTSLPALDSLDGRDGVRSIIPVEEDDGAGLQFSFTGCAGFGRAYLSMEAL